MDSKTNTIAGWILAAFAVALALSIFGHMWLRSERPEPMGYPIEGVQEGGGDSGAAAVAPIADRLAKADPAKGAETFKKCQTCHTINQGGPNGQGPNLYGVVGDHVAQGRGGFAFSSALAGIGGTWTFDKLDAWLTSPRKFAPGTKMTFAGLSDPQERADVIAYLNTQGSNLPLPKPDAPAAAASGAAPANGAAAETGAAPNAQAIAGESREGVTNQATPAPGAPSNDPHAAVEASKEAH
jgi:cytochrome c